MAEPQRFPFGPTSHPPRFDPSHVVGLARLSRVIAGSVEVLYLVVTGDLSGGTFLVGYLLPTPLATRWEAWRW